LVKKPDILFDANQKFFAVYDKKSGLVFSKELRPSKKRDLWMKKMNEKKFKSFGKNSKICDEKKCVIKKDGKKILVLLQRNKISEICALNRKLNFDVIVNLTAKYALLQCFSNSQTRIDNLDFYQKGAQFFYFSDEKIVIKTTS
jgi:hypothetical protein